MNNDRVFNNKQPMMSINKTDIFYGKIAVSVKVSLNRFG